MKVTHVCVSLITTISDPSNVMNAVDSDQSRMRAENRTFAA